jgi:hypothetical protein
VSGDARALLALLGRDDHERMTACHLAGGTFTSVITTVAEAPAVVAEHADGDCWYGTAVIHERVTSGRGAARDVIGVREVFADLDLKPGRMASTAAAEAVIRDLSAMLGVAPVAVVHSGHGLQPHWSIERDGDTDWSDETSPGWLAATALWRRWGRLVAHVASAHGGSVDNVYDLSRVLRTPGTVNRKGEPVPVTMDATGGGALSLTRLAECLDEYGVPAMPEDTERLDAVHSDAGSWTFADHTCGYARAMVAGWVTDKPTERHPWLVSQAIRLAAARRAGCFTEADHAAAVAVLADRFRTRLRVGRKRAEHLGEITGALAWGVQRASTFTDDRVLRELGGHVHVGDEEPVPEVDAATIGQVHAVFARWFGKSYDLDVLDAVLAVAAAGMVLDGDPANLLVVGGSGAAKTETVSPLAAAGALVTSTITSEGALLSGTSSKERTKDATGGLLRKVGDRGVLVIKDVTTILSMNRDARAAVLAGLREVADGYWQRNLGVDGGRTLTWRGHCTLIGAVTTAWDQAHGVIATMGDRFPLIRMPDDDALAGGAQALDNTGAEVAMRAELGAAVGGLLQHLTPAPAEPAAYRFVLPLANIVTWARTAVVTDYRGDVVDAHAREHPTRLSKQLAQIYRGALCIGLGEADAARLVVRVARDSLPPMRRVVLAGLLAQDFPGTSWEMARQVGRPRTSVDQQLQALVALGLAEFADGGGTAGASSAWRWQLSGRVDRDAMAVLASGNVGIPPHQPQSAQSAPPGEPPEGTTSSTSHTNTGYTNVSRRSGRCVRCGDACIRYGPGGNPLCPTCQQAGAA